MRTGLRWPARALLGLAVLGASGAFAALAADTGAREWYRSRVGGSSLYALGLSFARLLPFVVAAGAAFGLLFRSDSNRAASAREGDDTVRRHELPEVVTHWINAAGIGLGLLTAAMLLRWLRNPLSLNTTYLLHYIGAGLTVGAVAHYVAYEAAGGGGRLLIRSWSDVRSALGEVIGYLGVFRDRRGVFGMQLAPAVRRPLQRVVRALRLAPGPAGKYLAAEKAVSLPIWSLLIAIIIVTGVIKAARYVYPVPGNVLRGATYLHDGSTIFFVAFLLIHAASTTLVPRNWPLLRSMFTTRISRRYVREHLPEWERELEAGEDTPGHDPVARTVDGPIGRAAAGAPER